MLICMRKQNSEFIMIKNLEIFFCFSNENKPLDIGNLDINGNIKYCYRIVM